MPDEFQVDPDALVEAAREIDGWVSVLGSPVVPDSLGDVGAFGHPGVYAALSRFRATWDVASRMLSARAEWTSHELIRQAEEDRGTDSTVAIDVGRHDPDLPI